MVSTSKILVVVIVLIISSQSWAGGPAYTGLFPFLIDLKGWDADDATGMTMSGPSGNMLTVTRHYEQGAKNINVQIITGSMAQGAWSPFGAGFTIDTPEMLLKTMEVSGFSVGINHSKSENSGAVVVPLKGTDADAVFVLAYDGMGYEESLSLAKEFPWKELQKALR